MKKHHVAGKKGVVIPNKDIYKKRMEKPEKDRVPAKPKGMTKEKGLGKYKKMKGVLI
jgi:hypothetical protein